MPAIKIIITLTILSGQIFLKCNDPLLPLRNDVINFMWKDGLPLTKYPDVQTVSSFQGLESLNHDLIKNTKILTSNVKYGFTKTSAFLEPYNATSSLAILHQGHQGGIGDGLEEVINMYLSNGYNVIVNQMPFINWDPTSGVWDYSPEGKTFTLDDGTQITIPLSGNLHNQLFESDIPTGDVFSFFLEPIFQGVNYFKLLYPTSESIVMVGLSGGGWATALYMAIDTRVNLGFSVAGSVPLQFRTLPTYSRNVGDIEQNSPELFVNIASWEDIYVLGSTGGNGNRKEIAVHNEFDPCCFASNLLPNDYGNMLDERMKNLKGNWTYVIDEGSTKHWISDWTRNTIILPTIN